MRGNKLRNKKSSRLEHQHPSGLLPPWEQIEQGWFGASKVVDSLREETAIQPPTPEEAQCLHNYLEILERGDVAPLTSSKHLTQLHTDGSERWAEWFLNSQETRMGAVTMMARLVTLAGFNPTAPTKERGKVWLWGPCGQPTPVTKPNKKPLSCSKAYALHTQSYKQTWEQTAISGFVEATEQELTETLAVAKKELGLFVDLQTSLLGSITASTIRRSSETSTLEEEKERAANLRRYVDCALSALAGAYAAAITPPKPALFSTKQEETFVWYEQASWAVISAMGYAFAHIEHWDKTASQLKYDGTTTHPSDFWAASGIQTLIMIIQLLGNSNNVARFLLGREAGPGLELTQHVQTR